MPPIQQLDQRDDLDGYAAIFFSTSASIYNTLNNYERKTILAVSSKELATWREKVF
jgi:hypothetical protein